ncbi:hypothetical protein HPB47_019338, partial [Ixodes persulcatus]
AKKSESAATKAVQQLQEWVGRLRHFRTSWELPDWCPGKKMVVGAGHTNAQCSG